MDAFVDRADAYGAGVPIVVRSTNPEGRAIQAAAGKTGTVEATLLREIGQVNARLAPGRLGPVGAVIGPGHDADLDLRGAQAIFLAPGLGAQGATVADVARCFASCPERVLPSASRSLLASGPDRRQLRDSAGRLGDDLARALARP
jgi:orotidine-5'-phosphate decarboxylase